MEAVFTTGSKQFLVSKGDKILIPQLEAEAGSEVTFDQVLLITGDKSKVGTPFISGAKVKAKVLATEKGKKVIVFKYKRRKGYHKTKGHRQTETRVEIQDISI